MQCMQCLGVDILILLSTQSCILCVIRISRLLSRECSEDPQILKEVLSIRILIRLLTTERLGNLMIYKNMRLKPIHCYEISQDISFAPINIQNSNFLKFKWQLLNRWNPIELSSEHNKDLFTRSSWSKFRCFLTKTKLRAVRCPLGAVSLDIALAYINQFHDQH